MILRIQKKPGFILVHAPNGEVFPVTISEDRSESQICEETGRAVLEILGDDSQPEEVRAPIPTQRAEGSEVPIPEGASESEAHFRRALESMMPGSSKALTWLQGIQGSSDD